MTRRVAQVLAVFETWVGAMLHCGKVVTSRNFRRVAQAKNFTLGAPF
jgi:hypothetical protein